ncbi:MAG TPA: antibiotic biosynthesis monooxygenase [Chloroflexota bacterium]|nr:antibiotic biosynthesis monooxygenase [Chloroflexota bacterium]
MQNPARGHLTASPECVLKSRCRCPAAPQEKSPCSFGSRGAAFRKGQTESALERYRSRIVPSLRTQAGCQGAIALLDTDKSEALLVSFWDSAESLDPREAMAVAARDELAQTGNELVAALPQLDATLAFVNDQLIAALRSMKGYRATPIGINRTDGRMMVSSVWAKAADREESEPR